MKNQLHLHTDAIGIYASYVAFLFNFHELNMLLIIDMKVEITALPSYEYQEENSQDVFLHLVFLVDHLHSVLVQISSCYSFTPED
jgi:hypothetical protein